MNAEPMSEADALRHLMDTLPIYAAKVGYRYDSTGAERLLADSLFAGSG